MAVERSSIITLLLTAMVITWHLPVSGQNILLPETNAPRGGDIITLHPVSISSVGAAGNGMTWDMSGMEEAGDPINIEYVRKSDSLLTVTLSGTVYRYAEDSTGMRLSGYENPLSRMDIRSGGWTVTYPLRYGETLTSPFSGHGEYSGRLPMDMSGLQTMEADGLGVMILPGGDTLRNVMRVRSHTVSRITAGDPMTAGLGFDETLDEETHFWYAQGCRYPVLTHRSRVFLNDTVATREFHESWYTSPQSQYALRDSANMEVLYRNRQQYGGSALLRHSVSVSGSTVTIDFDLREDISMRFSVTGGGGVVYRQVSRNCKAGTGNTADIDCSGLHLGTYILYIHAGDTVLAEKITLK